MDHIRSEGVELDFEIKGSGEPVLLIHGTCIADAFQPLMDVPELADRFQLVRYHRRSYASSSQTSQLMSIADHAADARLVLEELYIDKAHVVGHDLGGVIALQLALDNPELVHSLTLAEPLLLMVPSWVAAVGGVSPALDLYLSGDKAAAVNSFLELSSGPDFLQALEARIPGAIAGAIRDAAAFFENDMLALGSWEFETSSPPTQPVLSILCERPADFFADGRRLIHEWLPQTEDLDLFNAGHLLQIDNPAGMGAGLSWFFSRHPMAPPGV